jgi:molecular chaperone DnaK
MAKPRQPAVGIDLGTTFSAVARLDDSGKPVTLINAEGDKITPSVIFLEGDNVVVGKEAVKALATDAAEVAECAKRDLGRRTFHKPLGGRQYPPEALQAWILNKMRVDAQRQIGDFSKVVITVPAYFDETRRKATQDAGYIAGFEVMDIINEPTAAAVAFGFEKGFLNLDRPEENTARNILVYDLGGGTFDVTVMKIEGRDFIALATDGDVQLGGKDWDQRLVDFVAEDFIRKFKVDPREDPNVNGRLWREAEDAKRTLSARLKTQIAIDYRGHAVRVEITRQQFDDMTRDLLDRTAFTTRQTLQAAGLQWTDLDRVLLVGGSTRMPAVPAMLKGLSGREPDASVSPDEAVAHGAALHAGILLDKYEGRAPNFKIRNVNSHSLGVVATDTATKRKRNAILVPRNTPLPVSAKRIFKTQKLNQQSILVQIVEGESASPDDCSRLGKCVVRNLPPDLPKQTPIEVRFKYEENGRLTVVVAVQGSGAVLKHELTRENSLTADQLDSWRRYISGVEPPAGVDHTLRQGETMDLSGVAKEPDREPPKRSGASDSAIRNRWV